MTFAKDSEELLFRTHIGLHISKCSFLEKTAFKTLPNAYIIFLVLKSAFCQRKVQTNGHKGDLVEGEISEETYAIKNGKILIKSYIRVFFFFFFEKLC